MSREIIEIPEACASFAIDMSRKLGIDVRAANSAQEAVRGTDIVVTATPARDPSSGLNGCLRDNM